VKPEGRQVEDQRRQRLRSGFDVGGFGSTLKPTADGAAAADDILPADASGLGSAAGAAAGCVLSEQRAPSASAAAGAGDGGVQQAAEPQGEPVQEQQELGEQQQLGAGGATRICSAPAEVQLDIQRE